MSRKLLLWKGKLPLTGVEGSGHPAVSSRGQKVVFDLSNNLIAHWGKKAEIRNSNKKNILSSTNIMMMLAVNKKKCWKKFSQDVLLVKNVVLQM